MYKCLFDIDYFNAVISMWAVGKYQDTLFYTQLFFKYGSF